MANKKINSL